MGKELRCHRCLISLIGAKEHFEWTTIPIGQSYYYECRPCQISELFTQVSRIKQGYVREVTKP